jgi:hypothetical protein
VRRVALALIVAGCSFRDGVKPTGDGGGSSAPDAKVCVGDLDCDTVLDGDDNCPDLANTAQDNEDGDRFGDACDPCPPLADDAPPDTDTDGVADACDPHPTTGGDQIALFEGFHHGVPAGWPSRGTWTAMDDGVMSDARGAAGPTWLVTPFAATGKETVSTSMKLLDKTNGGATAGITDMHETAAEADDGVQCALFDVNIFIFNFEGLAVAKDDISGEHDTSYNMSTNQTYVLSLTRDGMDYAGSIANNSQGKKSVTNQLDTMHAPFGAGLRLDGARATYAWLMVVTSP